MVDLAVVQLVWGSPLRVTLALLALAAPAATGFACDRLVGIPDVTLALGGTGGGDASASDVFFGEAADGDPCQRLLPDGASRPGPEMVLIAAGTVSYCIDTTEVTVGDFNKFLLAVAAGEAPTDPPDACAGPDAWPLPAVDPTTDQDNPVDHLVICHAWSYCQWAGKRLCGAIGDGGVVPYNVTAQGSEWGYACANGVLNLPFPYGTTYDAAVCKTESDGAVPVKSMKGCHGTMPPFDRIFDMSGNAWEWVNEISSNYNGATPQGGAWLTGMVSSCTPNMGGGFDPYVAPFDPSGFRCCADL